MKKVIEKWSGKYRINGKDCDNLKDFNPKNGEKFKIILLRRK